MPDTYEVLSHAIAHGWAPEESEREFADVEAFADAWEGDE